MEAIEMKFIEIHLSKDNEKKVEKLLVRNDEDEELIVQTYSEDSDYIVDDVKYLNEKVFDRIAEIRHELDEKRLTDHEYRLVVGDIISEYQVVV